MFHHVDTALEALLRSDAPLLADATISFEDPADEDSAMLRLQLWRVGPSAKNAVSGTEVVERDGVKVRRPRLPMMELSYALSADSADARQQHQLLAAALRTFLRHPAVPDEFVPAPLLDTGSPLLVRVPKLSGGSIDETQGADAFPGIVDVRVVVPMDLDHEEELPDAPESTDLGLEDQDSGATSSRQRFSGEITDPAAVGVDVLGPGGAATVEEDGRFVIAARPGDRLAIMVDPPITVDVPESGKIVVP